MTREYQISLAITTLTVAAIALLVGVACYLLLGCGHPLSAELPAPCDRATLAEGTAMCRDAVRSGCARDGGVPVASCPVLQECDRWVDAWLACHSDAGDR